MKRQSVCRSEMRGNGCHGRVCRSGSGDAEDGSNICHVHHQGQFFQRVILFLVHMASFLPFRESKFVFEWPRRIVQSKFFILFSSRRHGGRTRRLCGADLQRMRGQPAKPHTSARRAPRRGVNGYAVERFVDQPSILRTRAALGSGFTLQVAFWYQNAMLALFLRSKKSQKCSPILIPLRRIFCFSFCTSHKIQNFCASDAVVATLVAM